MKPSIALLGCGRMGTRMVRRWLGAGHVVKVWNRTPEKARALESVGAHVEETAACAVSGASHVVTMLSDGEAVDKLLFTQGVAEVLESNAVLIDMSSISPAMARNHAARLAEQAYLDAPVSGGTRGAEEGTLAIMCGGPAEVLERCQAIFEPLGKVTHVGPHGSGQLTKLCNQVIVATTIGAVSEALLLAQAGGANPEAALEALQGGFADSRILREHGQRMIQRDWRPGGITRYQVKDLLAAKAEAATQGISLPMLDEVQSLFSSLEQQGGAELDHAALLLELERRNAPHRVGTAPDLR